MLLRGSTGPKSDAAEWSQSNRWLIGRAQVFQEPQDGPSNTSQFDLTSIIATAKVLFNLSSFLTKRDAWAGTFDELLLDEPRGDTPAHLPAAPQNATPWGPPPGDVDGEARHCSSQHGATEEACRAPDEISRKQLGQLKLLSRLTGVEPPVAPDFAEASAWIQRRWGEWLDAN